MSSISIGLNFFVHLKFEDRICFKSESYTISADADADAILVAINKRSNTNINEGY